jgi:serine/threonine protein kinase
MHKIKYYMFQVLKAIEYMHRKNIFHRDIKPENILVTDDLVKVADLGSCKGTAWVRKAVTVNTLIQSTSQHAGTGHLNA